MLHKMVIPYQIIDDISNRNRAKLIPIISRCLRRVENNSHANNYALAQINAIVTDLIDRYTTYHGETMSFPSDYSTLSQGVELKNNYILMVRRASLFVADDAKKAQKFKNQMQNFVNHIDNDKLYVYTTDTLDSTLASRADVIQYLSTVINELHTPGYFIKLPLQK